MPAIVWTTDNDLRIMSSAGAGLAVLDEVPNQFVGGRAATLVMGPWQLSNVK
jgi:hypothetical protein